MDLIQSVLNQKGAELSSALIRTTGMDSSQAEGFLPEAARSMMDAMTLAAPDLDTENLGSRANTRRLIDRMDVAELASRAGVSASQGATGLSTVVPMVLDLMSESSHAGIWLGLTARARTLSEDSAT